jgi:hypothetical protein
MCLSPFDLTRSFCYSGHQCMPNDSLIQYAASHLTYRNDEFSCRFLTLMILRRSGCLYVSCHINAGAPTKVYVEGLNYGFAREAFSDPRASRFTRGRRRSPSVTTSPPAITTSPALNTRKKNELSQTMRSDSS